MMIMHIHFKTYLKWQMRKLKGMAKETYKFLPSLSPPIMNEISEVRDNMYNLRNFQSLYSTCKNL